MVVTNIQKGGLTMKRLKKEGGELLSNLLVLLAGVYFIWQRDQALVHIVVFAALLLALYGVWGMARWVFANPRPDAGKLALPIFLVVLGAVVFFLRSQITGVVPMLIGVLALFAGILQVLTVFKSIAAKQKAWWLHAPSALLWIVFGVLVLTGALNLNAVFTLVVGILLAVFGAVGLGESIAILCMRGE